MDWRKSEPAILEPDQLVIVLFREQWAVEWGKSESTFFKQEQLLVLVC
jgi:hypothetical protein